MHLRLPRLRQFLAAAIITILLIPTTALADPVVSYNFAGPVFGLAVAPDGSLLAPDAGAGIVELRKGTGSLVASLPNATDVAPIGRGDMFALTGGGDSGTDGRLFRVSRGNVRQIADLGAFEAAENPAGGEVDSNPFDVAVLNGGQALVADAGGNDLLIVNQRGQVDWIATLPNEDVSTDNAKALFGCPAGPPDICNLPDTIPAEPVATSIAIGPDGAYYVGELKGFPAPTGMSKVWRIEPGTRHAECGVSPACTVVADGFTSIVDLAFGPDGSLYVVELDENSWAAVELGLGPAGGTVNRCDSTTWTCSEVATGLPAPSAVALNRSGTLYAVINSLGPNPEVVTLP